jgi:hypothetical protein
MSALGKHPSLVLKKVFTKIGLQIVFNGPQKTASKSFFHEK